MQFNVVQKRSKSTFHRSRFLGGQFTDVLLNLFFGKLKKLPTDLLIASKLTKKRDPFGIWFCPQKWLLSRPLKPSLKPGEGGSGLNK